MNKEALNGSATNSTGYQQMSARRYLNEIDLSNTEMLVLGPDLDLPNDPNPELGGKRAHKMPSYGEKEP